MQSRPVAQCKVEIEAIVSYITTKPGFSGIMVWKLGGEPVYKFRVLFKKFCLDLRRQMINCLDREKRKSSFCEIWKFGGNKSIHI